MLKATWTDWDTAYEQDVSAWNEADALLDKLALQTDPPRLVEFYDPASGRALAIGVGRDSTVLTYQDSLDPPYFLSLGDPLTKGVEWFCYGNERTEYMAKNLVSY